MLEPTPERLDTARRVSAREWTMGAEGTAGLTTDPVLAEMLRAGFVEPRFVSAEALVAGRSDYYRLTAAGEAWLAGQDTEERPMIERAIQLGGDAQLVLEHLNQVGWPTPPPTRSTSH